MAFNSKRPFGRLRGFLWLLLGTGSFISLGPIGVLSQGERGGPNSDGDSGSSFGMRPSGGGGRPYPGMSSAGTGLDMPSFMGGGSGGGSSPSSSGGYPSLSQGGRYPQSPGGYPSPGFGPPPGAPFGSGGMGFGPSGGGIPGYPGVGGPAPSPPGPYPYPFRQSSSMGGSVPPIMGGGGGMSPLPQSPSSPTRGMPGPLPFPVGGFPFSPAASPRGPPSSPMFGSPAAPPPSGPVLSREEFFAAVNRQTGSSSSGGSGGSDPSEGSNGNRGINGAGRGSLSGGGGSRPSQSRSFQSSSEAGSSNPSAAAPPSFGPRATSRQSSESSESVVDHSPDSTTLSPFPGSSDPDLEFSPMSHVLSGSAAQAYSAQRGYSLGGPLADLVNVSSVIASVLLTSHRHRKVDTEVPNVVVGYRRQGGLLPKPEELERHHRLGGGHLLDDFDSVDDNGIPVRIRETPLGSAPPGSASFDAAWGEGTSESSSDQSFSDQDARIPTAMRIESSRLNRSNNPSRMETGLPVGGLTLQGDEPLDRVAYCYPFEKDEIIPKCSLAVNMTASGVYIAMMMEGPFNNGSYKQEPEWYNNIKLLRELTGLEVHGIAYDVPKWDLIAEIILENPNIFDGILLEWIGDGACISRVSAPSARNLAAIQKFTGQGIIRYFFRGQDLSSCGDNFDRPIFAHLPANDPKLRDLPGRLIIPDFIDPVFACQGGFEGMCYRAFTEFPSIACDSNRQRFAFNPFEYAGGRMMNLLNETCNGLPPYDLYGTLV